MDRFLDIAFIVLGSCALVLMVALVIVIMRATMLC